MLHPTTGLGCFRASNKGRRQAVILGVLKSQLRRWKFETNTQDDKLALGKLRIHSVGVFLDGYSYPNSATIELYSTYYCA